MGMARPNPCRVHSRSPATLRSNRLNLQCVGERNAECGVQERAPLALGARRLGRFIVRRLQDQGTIQRFLLSPSRTGLKAAIPGAVTEYARFGLILDFGL